MARYRFYLHSTRMLSCKFTTHYPRILQHLKSHTVETEHRFKNNCCSSFQTMTIMLYSYNDVCHFALFVHHLHHTNIGLEVETGIDAINQ